MSLLSSLNRGPVAFWSRPTSVSLVFGLGVSCPISASFLSVCMYLSPRKRLELLRVESRSKDILDRPEVETGIPLRGKEVRLTHPKGCTNFLGVGIGDRDRTYGGQGNWRRKGRGSGVSPGIARRAPQRTRTV